ncbi:MAG: hypothetical protein ACRCZ9_12435 [Fusobacteriaceae bacterium]
MFNCSTYSGSMSVTGISHIVVTQLKIKYGEFLNSQSFESVIKLVKDLAMNDPKFERTMCEISMGFNFKTAFSDNRAVQDEVYRLIHII